jgi:outer membrane protein assembly factor BamE (lipoprotein component of BamABCDE complex)
MAILAASLGISGCSGMLLSAMYSTPRLATEKLSQIKEGVSTKADVIRLLGQPTSVSKDSDGSEVLRYTSTQYPALMGVVGAWKAQSIEVQVDKAGVVQKYQVWEGDTVRSNF